MWLLNAQHVVEGSLHTSLTEFLVEEERPRYAILSHTWIAGQEVSFREVRNSGEHRDQKLGWSKIQQTARLALEYDPRLEWIWIDTCCINKEDPNEISTAINSMYVWYRDAAVCFVYLQDVMPMPKALLAVIDESMEWRADIQQHEKKRYIEELRTEVVEAILQYDGAWRYQKQADESLRRTKWSVHPETPPDLPESFNSGRRYITFYNRSRRDHDIVSWCRDLSNSRWFTRGWTLQELIASRKCKFYTTDWTFIASKTQASFARLLGRITKIPASLLSGQSQLNNHSVAEKMSWAAQRQTTRAEDIAYCLLGIFGISMAPLYGEGQRTAFKRLQRKILKSGSYDNSIFLWTNACGTGGSYCDLFAQHPNNYDCSSLYSLEQFSSLKYQKDMDVTSLIGGIEFNASLVVPNQLDYLTFHSPLPTEANLALRWLDQTKDLYLLLLLHQGREHQIDCRGEQYGEPRRNLDRVIIPAVIVKRLTSGNSQFVRAFSAWTIHIALEQWFLNKGRSIIIKERIRVLQDASLLKLPAIERNIQLAAVRFAKRILIPSGAEVDGISVGPLGTALQCEQPNPSCSQITIELDLRAIAPEFWAIEPGKRGARCKNMELPHRYVLAFVSATSNSRSFNIMERTLIESSAATGVRPSEKYVVAQTQCPDCYIHAESADLGGPRLRVSFENGLVVGSVARLSVSPRSENGWRGAVRNMPFKAIRVLG